MSKLYVTTRDVSGGRSPAVQYYADIIRQDFEVYITDIQDYFRCLEQERVRAFEEAREVSQDYGRFLELVGE